ncbi:MAG: hypothetical protein EOO28_16795 [Comamonadaceae bacterium]|nr:MAG: hypothetical protein EOO28_16795 [Comamonadaceae bacterium]
MKPHSHWLKTVCTAALAVLVTPVAMAQAKAPSAVAAGHYECWANGSARGMMNFAVTGKDAYTGDGAKGKFTYDSSSGKIAFKGGHLDGVMPDGFVSVYHEKNGRPTVSFRSARGSEASFCERVK